MTNNLASKNFVLLVAIQLVSGWILFPNLRSINPFLRTVSTTNSVFENTPTILFSSNQEQEGQNEKQNSIGASYSVGAENTEWFESDPFVHKPDNNGVIQNDETKQNGHQSGYDLGLGKNMPIGNENENEDANDDLEKDEDIQSGYDLGLGKNMPVGKENENSNDDLEQDVDTKLHWYAPEPVQKPPKTATTIGAKEEEDESPSNPNKTKQGRTIRKMVARTQQDQILRGALWHEDHYDNEPAPPSSSHQHQSTPDTTSSNSASGTASREEQDELGPKKPELFYPDIDLSIPDTIYSESTDVIWDLMRWEAYQEAQREPLLVSFLYSSILNHDSLESSLAFLLANKLSSPAMISTQVQSLVAEALQQDPSIGRALRADIMAVRDRDPACTCLPDVFLYFKGFQALQTYRVSHVLWNVGKQVLAHYLQSQMSQTFQIDIHPNATLGSGIMLDHGTGIVIGETATVGHNCSILHHVTLGGSGKKGVDRHPKIGEGVLLGAGSSVLGNVKIGDGCQVGAGTLVITDLPEHTVAVGVPAKIIGSFINVTEQPSMLMNQMMDSGFVTFESDGI